MRTKTLRKNPPLNMGNAGTSMQQQRERHKSSGADVTMPGSPNQALTIDKKPFGKNLAKNNVIYTQGPFFLRIIYVSCSRCVPRRIPGGRWVAVLHKDTSLGHTATRSWIYARIPTASKYNERGHRVKTPDAESWSCRRWCAKEGSIADSV